MSVGTSSTEGQSSSSVSSVTIIETNSYEFVEWDIMSSTSVSESSSNSKLVSFSGGLSSSEMDLYHSSWSGWHNLISKNISEIVRCKRIGINFMGNKSIVKIRVSSVN